MGLHNKGWGPWSYENAKAYMGELTLSESEEGEGESREVVEVLETPVTPKAKSKKASAKRGSAAGLERIAEGIENLERTMRTEWGGIQDTLRKILEVQKKWIESQGDKNFYEGKFKRAIGEVEGVENREEGSSKRRTVT